MHSTEGAPARADIDEAALKQLFHDFIQAALQGFISLGLWPRPAAERYMELGQHFSVPDVEHLPELQRLHQYFEGSEFIKRHYYPERPALWSRLLGVVLAETEGDQVRAAALGKHFRRYFRELVRAHGTWRQVDTLTGLRCEKAFELDKHSVVTPNVAVSYHLRGWVHFPGLGPGIDDKVALVTTVTVEKQALWTSPHELGFPQRAMALVEAVRLLKPGVPRLHCHARSQLSSFPFERPFGWEAPDGELVGDEREAVIEASDTRRVRALWKELLARHGHRRWAVSAERDGIEIALGRFNRAYENTGWLDRIADLTIAIEALVSPADRDELRHRVALRAAHLLGSGGSSSAAVYQCVRDMYDARSDIVHGKGPDEKRQAKWLSALSGLQYDYNRGTYPLIQPALEVARDIVRRLTRGCARLSSKSKPGPRWPLPKDFDRLMLDASQRRLWQREFQR
jgi:hypothetical protein